MVRTAGFDGTGAYWESLNVGNVFCLPLDGGDVCVKMPVVCFRCVHLTVYTVAQGKHFEN